MRDAQVAPFQIDPNGLFRYTRTSWRSAGVDNYTKAPGQNPDRFLQLTNILSPEQNVLLRRWGYRSFKPQLDNGATASSDENVPSANALPTIKANQLYDFEDNTLGERTIIATASDGSGMGSLTNQVVYFDATGFPQTIFTPSFQAGTVRMVNSRDYAFFVDGVQGDQQKWSFNIGLENWGIVAPDTAITVGTPTGGGALSFALSAVANASGGNTVYTGIGLGSLIPSTFVTIGGFTNAVNDGTFNVVSATPTTVTVNNAVGVAETNPGVLTTSNQFLPSVSLNGWAANAHISLHNDVLGLNPGVTNPYTSPNLAIDNNDSTFAYAVGEGSGLPPNGCVWGFSALSSGLTNASLHILSEIPTSGTDGFQVGGGESAIYFSLDGGNTWTQIYYSQVPRTKQFDTIALPNGQDYSKVQVMALMQARNHMYHKVYTINIQGSTLGSGPITIFAGRRYYFVYGNSITGHLSDLSPISVSTLAISGGSVPLSNIETSSDPQVDSRILLATADGGDPSILYYVATLDNTVTTYLDGTPEPDLLLANTYLFTDSTGTEFGVTDNTPPPNGNFPLKHLGRLFMIEGEFVVFSKSIAELTTNTGIIAGRYEEAWPASYQLDISQSAEVGTGLLSDGQTLYVGTSRAIRRITGSTPDTFSAPQVVFNEVGLLGQSTWQIVFAEGQPMGSMWMTPDLRVIMSDFNTYVDVGTTIQTTLNSTNRIAVNNIWSTFYTDGVYSYYILALPTGNNTVADTICLYDLKLREWFIWQFADKFLSGLFYFNLTGLPRWIMADSNGIIRFVDKNTTDDRALDTSPVNVTHTIQTTWLDLGQIVWPNTGDSSIRKVINEIEIETDILNTAITVDGASSAQTFEVPNNVVTNGQLVLNPFGTYKLFLVGYPTIDRFYRVTFTGTSVTGVSTPNDVLLGTYSFVVRPIHRY